MKRFVLFFLTVCIVAILFGCDKTDYKDIISPIKNFDSNESLSVNGDKDAFSVSTKKLKGSDGEVIVLYIENKTDTDYDLTVKGSFYGKEAESIEERTIFLEGFSAGAHNYCFFENKSQKKEFSFELDAVPSKAEAYLSSIRIDSTTTEAHSYYYLLETLRSPVTPEEMESRDDLDEMSAEILMTFINENRANITGEVVFFRNDEFICKSTFSFGNFIGKQSKYVSLPGKAVRERDSFVNPEKYQGELTYVVSILSIEPVE